jgi:hypothetical protein
VTPRDCPAGCGRKKLSHRRLCWRCTKARGRRPPYEGREKYAPRDTLGYTQALPAPAPTDARPGTAAKLAVLAARAERGEALWSRGDAVACDELRNLGVA